MIRFIRYIAQRATTLRRWYVRNEYALWMSIFVLLVGIMGFVLGEVNVAYKYNIMHQDFQISYDTIPSATTSGGESRGNTVGSGSTPTAADAAQNPASQQNTSPATRNANPALFVGNKNSSIYFPKDCATVNHINEENKVYFSTEQDAVNQGFRKAKNCT